MSERKSYSYAKQDGRPNIAMPPEGEVSSIERLTNPAYQSQPIQQAPQEEPVVFNNVPDAIPKYAPEYEANDDDSSQTEESLDEPVVNQRFNAPIEEKTTPKSSGENFKELRLARERAEKRAEQQEALVAHLLALQAQAQASGQNKQPVKKQSEPEEDLLADINDDAFIEGKDYKKLAKAIKRQSDESARKTAEYEQRIADMAAESKVRAKCPDLDQVVTEENIYLLRERHPDVAAALNAAPDGWDKYSSVYTMIKSLGIHKTRAYDRDKAQTIANSQKPKPAASLSPQVGESALTGVNAFVQDRKLTKDGASSVWKEMQDAMKKA